MKRYSALFFIHCFALLALAQPAQGYYSEAEGKSDAALRTALHNIIKNPSVLSYGGLWTAFRTTDRADDGKVWDMYSDCGFTFGTDQCGTYAYECDCYNREHSFPKSWFGDTSPMNSDLYHLYPTDGKVNGMRSNYPFGEVGDDYESFGTAKRGNGRSGLGYTRTVFEPADEYKGDFARTYFYMITCYQNRVSGWNSDMLSGNGFTTWANTMLLTWHRNDPVSQKEIDRNNAVEGFQNNRNPFIDYPELVEFIFGNRRGDVWTLDDVPAITEPSNGSVIDLGTVAYQQSKSAVVRIKGVNLTDNVNLSISGDDAHLFSLSEGVISKNDALSGHDITVYFVAQEVGEMSASLNIASENAYTVNLELKAISTDDFMALPATYISSNGFTANWSVSANATGYSLDVYTLQNSGQTVYSIFLDENFENGLPSGWSKSGYIEEVTSAIRLASGKSIGSITTPAIDFSNKEAILTVQAQQYSNDDGAELTVSLNNSDIAVWQTDKTVKDYTVEIQPVESGQITLTARASERVFVEAVKIESKGSVPVRISIAGYPQSVGNEFSHAVTGLANDSTYYYAVTPEGNGGAESNSVEVRTLPEGSGGTALPESEANIAYWIVSNDVLYIYNLPESCSLRLIDVSGKQINSAGNCAFEAQMQLPRRGAYLLQVIENEQSKVYKILY